MAIERPITPENLFDNIEAVIFDMDGTMVNNMQFHKESWKEFCKRHNVPITDGEFRQRISGKKNNDIFEIVFGRKLSDEEIEQLGEEKEAIYREIYSAYIEEVPGLSDLVQKLKIRKLKVAIATTAIAPNRKFVLENLNLDGQQFDAIVGDEHVKHGKPNPEIFILTAKEIGVSPEKCLVFEDSPAGVQAARNAGMRVAGILTTHTAEELNQADITIHDFREVLIAA